MLTVFVCMCGKWIEEMHAVMHIYGFGSCIYFLQIIILGNFLLLNLFISILLKNWEPVEEDQAEFIELTD